MFKFSGLSCRLLPTACIKKRVRSPAFFGFAKPHIDPG